MARRPAARDAQGERAHLNALSRRLRVPARGAGRADADAVPPRGLRVGARAGRRAAATSSRTASTAASSSPATTTSGCSTARSRATTTRRRRATASRRCALDRARASVRRAALRRRGRARVRLFASTLGESPGGLLDAARGAGGPRVAADASVLIAATWTTARAWQRALERRLRPTVRVFNIAGVALPPELAKGRAPATGAVAWVCHGTQCLPPIDDLAGRSKRTSPA